MNIKQNQYRNQSGYVLVLVLGIVFLCSLLVNQLAHDMVLEQQRLRNQIQDDNFWHQIEATIINLLKSDKPKNIDEHYLNFIPDDLTINCTSGIIINQARFANNRLMITYAERK